MERLTKPEPKPKNKLQYNLRIEADLMEWLKAQAKQYDRPVNYIVNHAIKQLKKQQEI